MHASAHAHLEARLRLDPLGVRSRVLHRTAVLRVHPLRRDVDAALQVEAQRLYVLAVRLQHLHVMCSAGRSCEAGPLPLFVVQYGME